MKQILLYGCGDRKYMKELIADWLDCDMYGQEQAVFKVVKVFLSEDIAESEE